MKINMHCMTCIEHYFVRSFADGAAVQEATTMAGVAAMVVMGSGDAARDQRCPLD